MTHVWYWRSKLPERKGEPCRVLVRGKMNSILVEFADGFQVVTSRYAVRRLRTFDLEACAPKDSDDSVLVGVYPI